MQLSRAKRSRAEPSRAEGSRAEPSGAERSRGACGEAMAGRGPLVVFGATGEQGPGAGWGLGPVAPGSRPRFIPGHRGSGRLGGSGPAGRGHRRGPCRDAETQQQGGRAAEAFGGPRGGGGPGRRADAGAGLGGRLRSLRGHRLLGALQPGEGSGAGSALLSRTPHLVGVQPCGSRARVLSEPFLQPRQPHWLRHTVTRL